MVLCVRTVHVAETAIISIDVCITATTIHVVARVNLHGLEVGACILVHMCRQTVELATASLVLIHSEHDVVTTEVPLCFILCLSTTLF